MVPAGLGGVVAIAAGIGHTLALKSDGTVVAWGNNNSGQTTVPTYLQGGVVAIAAGGNTRLAMTSSGSGHGLVRGWGNLSNQTPIDLFMVP